jgi:hypothetical protein
MGQADVCYYRFSSLSTPATLKAAFHPCTKPLLAPSTTFLEDAIPTTKPAVSNAMPVIGVFSNFFMSIFSSFGCTVSFNQLSAYQWFVVHYHSTSADLKAASQPFLNRRCNSGVPMQVIDYEEGAKQSSPLKGD